MPLVFQSFEEWRASELGLHPIQVALQVSLPEIDGAIEPIIYAGREGATGRSVPLADRVQLLAERAMKWADLRRKENKVRSSPIFTPSPSHAFSRALVPCELELTQLLLCSMMRRL